MLSDLSNSNKSDFLNLISVTFKEKDQRVAFLTLPKPAKLPRAPATVSMQFGNRLTMGLSLPPPKATDSLWISTLSFSLLMEITSS